MNLLTMFGISLIIVFCLIVLVILTVPFAYHLTERYFDWVDSKFKEHS